MRTLNLFGKKTKSQAMGYSLHIGKRLSLLALISICFLCFMPPAHKVSTTHSKQHKVVVEGIDPEDMVQNSIYFFADHGSGMSVAKFDRMDGNDIYTFNSIKPLQLSYSGAGLWGTVEDAGNIRLPTLTETIQLLLSILAGAYVPYP